MKLFEGGTFTTPRTVLPTGTDRASVEVERESIKAELYLLGQWKVGSAVVYLVSDMGEDGSPSADASRSVSTSRRAR